MTKYSPAEYARGGDVPEPWGLHVVESAGHLAWVRPEGGGEVLEYFVRCGDVLRAPISCVVMPDGYRCGRFECPLSMWERMREMIETWGEVKE